MMDQSSDWTIRRLLEWTADYFKQRDFESPRLDAEVLLAAALQCERIDLYARFDEIPGDPQRDQYRQWVRDHAAGQPVAYLVGHREFFSLSFAVC